jgi:hypothetical protein
MANFLSTPHSQASYGGSFDLCSENANRPRTRSTLERELSPLKDKIHFTPLFKVSQKKFHLYKINNPAAEQRGMLFW